MAEIKKGAASTFVEHSEGKGAPAHVPDVGAIWRSWEAAVAPEAREDICANVGVSEGIANGYAVLARTVTAKSLKTIMKGFLCAA